MDVYVRLPGWNKPLPCRLEFRLKRLFRSLLYIALMILACFPVSFILTFLLMPLWSWVEARFGIESVGHSTRRIGVFGLFSPCSFLACFSSFSFIG